MNRQSHDGEPWSDGDSVLDLPTGTSLQFEWSEKLMDFLLRSNDAAD